jgi:thermitase
MERNLKVGCAVALACLAGAPAAEASRPPKYDAHTVIVKYRDGSSGLQRSLLRTLDGLVQTVGRVTGLGAEVVRVLGHPAAVAAKLNRSPDVLYAEPNYMLHTLGQPQIPDDARFGELYNLHNTGQGGGKPGADIHAPEGWGASPSLIGFPRAQDGVKVGMVDTGILLGHEDFAGRKIDCAGVANPGFFILELFADPTIVPGKCEDDNGHGTHTAGIMGAAANNGIGVAGVAFNSPLSICKAEGGMFGSGAVAGIANCITYLARQGAKVISMSIGGLTPSITLDNAVAEASRTALLVSASGNDSSATKLSYPGAYPEVVMVGATDRNDQRAAFSNYNDKVEISAPGDNVLSTLNNGGYSLLSGTSMATPQVAGAAALIAGRYPKLGPEGWRAKLDLAVDDLGAPGRDPEFGYGRLNLEKALTQ